MGTYKFSDEVFEKIYNKLYDSDIEDLMIGTREFIDIEGKTIDEVLELLEEAQYEREDRIGAIQRHLKYTHGEQKLTEEAEDALANDQYLSFLITQVKILKQWLTKDT